MIQEEAIRQRSYLIWQREGRPDGRALDHWLRAKAELEAEFQASAGGSGDWRHTVMPRLPISRRPERIVARRVPDGGPPTEVSAAKQ